MTILRESDSCACGAPHRISAARLIRAYRTSSVPMGSPKMAATQRVKIQRDLIRMRRSLMIEGSRGMAKTLRGFFTQKLDEICDKVELHARHHLRAAGVPQRKAGVDIGFGSAEHTWKQAIQEVLGPSATVELTADYLPTVQSIAAKSYSRTCLFLGDAEAADASVKILRRAQAMARQVTSINETTRDRLINSITGALDDGQTLAETIATIRSEIPEIAAGRIPTIARTEVGRAIDEGTKEAMGESSTITHVRVIGCEAIEPKIPTMDGVPTCNICGVPVSRLDELEFHINHTGCIVPQFFVDDGYSGPIYSGGAAKD